MRVSVSSMVTSVKGPRKALLFFVLFALILPIIGYLQGSYLHYAEDDAYIHMRIARNLWLHKTPFFNLGERVNASTSPAWILITAPLAAFEWRQVAAVASLNTVLTALACATWGVLFALLTPTKTWFFSLAAALLTLATLLPSSLGLMETPLATLCVGGALTLLLFGKSIWIFPATLAPFVRPECAVFLPALLALRVRGGAPKVLEGFLALLAILPLVAFQLTHFGTLWPHTAHAKSIVYQVTSNEFIRLLCYGCFGEEVTKRILPFVLVAAVFGACLLIVRASRISIVKPQPWFFVVAPACVIVAAYAANRVVIFPWYPALFLIPLHLWMLSFVIRAPALGSRCLAALALVPVVFQSTLYGIGLVDPVRAPNFPSGTRASRLLEVGATLYSRYPGATLLAPEIGALGFSYQADIIDAVGLVTPRALAFHPMSVPHERSAGFLGAVPVRLVVETKPTLIVGLEALMEAVLRSNAVSEYRRYDLSPVATQDRLRVDSPSVWGSAAIVLLVRNDAPEPPAELLKR